MTVAAIPARIMAKLVEVDRGYDSPCWEWQGTRVGSERPPEQQYGRVWWRGRMVLVHRLVWWLVRGYSPKGGYVLHRCDNPPCCNPEHLSQGTLSQNNRHQYKRGRRNRPQELFV